MNEIQLLIEKILNHFAGEKFKDELISAKKFFFESSGILDEHTDSFEIRMSQFYDWYFFSRPLIGYGRTPLAVCQETRELRFNDDELKLIEVLKNHKHSLFELIKIKNGDIHIKDLFTDQKLVVRESSCFFGFEPDEIFEVRLFPTEGGFIFSKGFCFHPPTAKKFIQGEIKKHKKDPDLDPEVFMFRLLKMRYKYDQYRHVAPEMIYSDQNLLKV